MLVCAEFLHVEGLIQTLGAVIDAAAFSTSDRQKLVKSLDVWLLTCPSELFRQAPRQEHYLLKNFNLLRKNYGFQHPWKINSVQTRGILKTSGFMRVFVEIGDFVDLKVF